MTYREWSPGPELADRVVCFWTSGLLPPDQLSFCSGHPPSEDPPGRMPGKKMGTSAGTSLAEVDSRSRNVTAVKRILPDGCMDIIWGPEGVQVAGPDTRAHLTPDRPDATYVAVRFLPGGAGSIFGVPADALTDLRLPLSELWDGDLPWHAPPHTLDDVRSFRTFVAGRLRATDPVPDPTTSALRLALTRGNPVPKVACELGLSERTLRRRSLAAFGYGPKTLQRILRFQDALRRARQGDDLAQVAHECGYADQAHFANEVTDLAGVPVTQLR